MMEAEGVYECSLSRLTGRVGSDRIGSDRVESGRVDYRRTRSWLRLVNDRGAERTSYGDRRVLSSSCYSRSTRSITDIIWRFEPRTRATSHVAAESHSSAAAPTKRPRRSSPPCWSTWRRPVRCHRRRDRTGCGRRRLPEAPTWRSRRRVAKWRPTSAAKTDTATKINK
ncbi:hypothetical protein V9T40_007916 [Parthenolecanium corni]|uniref:Uncharacterized protein n=1 Tax=Parthenolecanium corni TaxID=536013 RepID=A0AAN9Y940_9HEMI